MYKEQKNYPDYIRGRFSPANSAQARDLIEKQVTPSEKERPSMAEVLKHEWFKMADAASTSEVLKSCTSKSASSKSSNANN